MTEPATHVLESGPDTVSAGVLDPSRPPALTITPGDVVSCPNTWTQWGNQARFGMSFADREPLRKRFPTGPYSNLGPVVIEGAEPGDAIECHMLRTFPIDWGWNSFPLGVGALPADFDEPYVHYFRFSEDRRYAPFVDGVRIPLKPSMGVYAVEPEGDEPVSAILAGPAATSTSPSSPRAHRCSCRCSSRAPASGPATRTPRSPTVSSTRPGSSLGCRSCASATTCARTSPCMAPW